MRDFTVMLRNLPPDFEFGGKDLITQIGIQMVTENGTGLPNEDIIAE